MSRAPSRGDTALRVEISGTNPSDPIDLRAASSFGFTLPATFTSTAITFDVSHDGTTFTPLHGGSGVISLTVAQGNSYTAPPEASPWPWVRLSAGSSESSARVITVVRLR